MASIMSFKVGKIVNDSECCLVAEEEWIKFVKGELGNWAVRFRRLRPWKNKDGIIVVSDRLSEWFKMPWNQSELILIPNQCAFTQLYILRVHNEDHSAQSAVTKVRRKFWVLQLIKSVRTIKNACVTCRLVDKKTEQQKMGSLHLDRMSPSPLFYILYLIDFFGPIYIKDTVKGRSRGKAYGVIFNCGTCHAVYIDVADKYDTGSFASLP